MRPLPFPGHLEELQGSGPGLWLMVQEGGRGLGVGAEDLGLEDSHGQMNTWNREAHSQSRLTFKHQADVGTTYTFVHCYLTHGLSAKDFP